MCYNYHGVFMMNVLVELTYIGWDCTIQRRGSFPVNQKIFNKNNEAAAAEIAIKWIREIRRNEQISRLISVKFNGHNDITDLVTGVLNNPLEDIPWF